MNAGYRSNFLLLAAAMQLLMLTLPALAFAQDCTPQEIELTSQLEVDQFQANHGPCDRVLTNLVIRGEDTVNFGGLLDLTSVLGDLRIEHNPSLKTIDGLANLQSVGGLIIWFNPSLLKIDGLSSLASIDKENGLQIRFNTALQSVSGFNELSVVDSLFIQSNPFLTNLEGFAKLNQIGGILVVRVNSLLDLEGFSSLTSVGGLFLGESMLTNLDGLSHLTDVTGDLSIQNSDALISIDALSGIAQVGGDLVLLHNRSLSRCMGITHLVDQIDDSNPGPGVGVAPDVGGEIAIGQNAIGCNSIEEILAEEPLLGMNAGLNDTWFNPETDGQGFFVIVYPQIEQIFLAWFTYDIVLPPMDVTASVGEPGHRWFTAQGPYVGNRASLILYNTSGGIFDSSEPVPTSQPDGNIVLEFSSCGRGTVTYDIHSIDWQSTIPIERIVADNIALCEALNSQ